MLSATIETTPAIRVAERHDVSGTPGIAVDEEMLRTAAARTSVGPGPYA
jgi:hypothetical protein